MAWPSRCNAGPACFAARPHAGAAGCSAPQRHRAAVPEALGTSSSQPQRPDLLASAAGLHRLPAGGAVDRSEEHTSELQSHLNIVCRLLLEKKKTDKKKCLHLATYSSLSTQSRL